MVLKFLKQLFCKHEFHITFTSNRTFEKCHLCDKENPGWLIDDRRKHRLIKRRRTAEQDKKIVEMKRKRA